jgi:hypothetical protein
MEYYAPRKVRMDALILILLAIALRLAAGTRYFIATCKGTVKPNPVTWLFWGLAPLIAALAQLQNGATPATWATLALSIGPLAIFVAALRVKVRHWKIGPFDMACGAFAAVGIILWQITSDPVVALVFGILADIAGGIPTVRKAYIAPRTEEALPYMLSAISMVLTVCTVRDWEFINYGFPVYIFCINTLIATVVLTQNRKR